MRISRKPHPPRPVPVLPLGGAPAGVEPGGRVVAHFAKTTSAATRARASPDRAPARAEPGGRVVVRFRKPTSAATRARPSAGWGPGPGRARQEGRCAISQTHVRRGLWPSFPGWCPGPGRARREGRCAISQTHIRRDLCPSFRRVVPRPGPSPARGSLRDFANPRPPRPLAVLPRVAPRPGSNPARGSLRNFAKATSAATSGRPSAGWCPGPGRARREGRCAISQTHVRRDLWPSFPGSWPRPCRARPGPSPAGGSLRNFAKATSAATSGRPSPGRYLARAEPGVRSQPRREGCCAISRKAPAPLQSAPTRHIQPPSRPLAPVGLHHVRQHAKLDQGRHPKLDHPGCEDVVRSGAGAGLSR